MKTTLPLIEQPAFKVVLPDTAQLAEGVQVDLMPGVSAFTSMRFGLIWRCPKRLRKRWSTGYVPAGPLPGFLPPGNSCSRSCLHQE